MKKLFVLLIFIFILGGCTSSSPGTSLNDQQDGADKDEISEFVIDDLIVGNNKYGDALGDVKAVLGEPAASNIYKDAVTGNDVTELKYADGNSYTFIKNADLKEPVLQAVNIVTKDVATARGLLVGSSEKDVIESFKNENTGTRILYAADMVKLNESETIIVPPRGYMTDEPDEKGRLEICYDIPVKPYESQNEIDNFVYQQHGRLMFFIKDGVVDEYLWYVGAMAE